MRKTSLFVGMVAVMIASPASGGAVSSLEDFVVRANRIPLNATAMLRPDAHRLKAEADRSISAVVGEIRQARAAGRAPPACPPDRISMNPRQLLAYLNTIPSSRRQRMSVTDGIRAWFADQFPCST